MSATIKDVAREAGVAVSTVSRMLNNSGPVNSVTRSRIEKAAAALRYVPNAAARSLITNKTRTVGVLLPNLYGEFYAGVIRGLNHAAQSHRYHLLVSSAHNERSQLDAAIQTMLGRVDGLVIMAPDVALHAIELNLSQRVPVVFLNCPQVDGISDSVRLDNLDAARRMTEHLISLGHKRIALITGGLTNVDAVERVRGYRDALEAAGIPHEVGLEVEGNFSESSGYEAALKALSSGDRPSALFCCNDSMAVGAMSAARELGLRIPRDVAIVGFDDVQIARYMDPPLTSVHVPISDMSAKSIEYLLDAVTGSGQRRQLRRQEVVKAELRIRASCGAALD